ncbi:lipoprotein insertase outer membrane protein LolB [Undibacterium sp. CY21W]|uniref:lipoprotein insertase outer membrane protein LolB n=1 Tax=Undibacterium sp. CY21W TaxID=2762293 RepID=UPI00164CD4CA|nr:lipoprotein insertase outer membrane protein LolB [Undibacterium sp. CY21W]MBC3927171.1 outer membrane lipoprotein LolB [Undibacterium sp. CY21W]
MNRYSRIFMLLTGLSGALLSSACSSLPQATTNSAERLHSVSRSYQETIHLSGKISVRYEHNNKPQNLPGSFEWEQTGNSLQITLFSPVGQTIAKITQNERGALLEQEGKMPQQADNLDQLLADALRWPLPVSGMRDWLQGFIRQSDGSRTALTASDQTISSDGWNIRYASWHESTNSPKRIDLNRYTTSAGEVTLNIFIEAPQNP